MSTNPASANYQPVADGEAAERAVRRAKVITEATEGDAGGRTFDEREEAKAAMARSQT